MHLDPTTANVLDELATPMLRLDPAGVVSAANIAAAGWLGVGRKRLLGLHAAALEREGNTLAALLAQAPETPTRLRRMMLAFPGSEQVQFADLWLVPTQQGHWLEVHPVDEIAGGDPAQLLPSALSASLKGLAHELRNPLLGIKGAAQLLARRGGNEARPRFGKRCMRPRRQCSLPAAGEKHDGVQAGEQRVEMIAGCCKLAVLDDTSHQESPEQQAEGRKFAPGQHPQQECVRIRFRAVLVQCPCVHAGSPLGTRLS